MDEKEEGILLGELRQFKTDTLRRLDNIETSIGKLTKFKWKIVGGAVVVVGLIEGYLKLRGIS